MSASTSTNPTSNPNPNPNPSSSTSTSSSSSIPVNSNEVEALKSEGNNHFAAGRFHECIDCFTRALALDPKNHVLYSNRAAGYASLQRFQDALDDARRCIEVKPDFVKGYSRMGGALIHLGRLEEAKTAYEQGLKQHPNNAQLIAGMDDVKQRIAAAETRKNNANAMPNNPFGSLFGPDALMKLALNPSTAHLARDKAFQEKLKLLQTNPQAAMTTMLQDKDIMTALSVLLNLNADTNKNTSTGEYDEEEENGSNRQKWEMEQREKQQREQKEQEERERKEKEANMTKEEKEAEEEAAIASRLYKERKPEQAIGHWEKASTLDPIKLKYYNNRAAALLEMKRYEEVIELEKRAIEIGMEHQADFKDRARAYERMAKAYVALGSLDAAIDAFERSLLEHQDDKVRLQLKEIMQRKKKAEEEAYVNPEKSEEARERGNALFKEGKWKEAIDEYTEAIKRNPMNAKAFSNRAACYQKLMTWGAALADVQKAIEIDPQYAKAYARKGQIELFLKDYHKALETFERGLKADPTNQELMDGRRRVMVAINSGDESEEAAKARAERAMADPDIQRILKDPTINKVLGDLQRDPASGQRALADPTIRASIEKLVAAGIIKTK